MSRNELNLRGVALAENTLDCFNRSIRKSLAYLRIRRSRSGRICGGNNVMESRIYASAIAYIEQEYIEL